MIGALLASACLRGIRWGQRNSVVLFVAWFGFLPPAFWAVVRRQKWNLRRARRALSWTTSFMG